MLSFLAVSLGKSLRFLLRLIRKGGGSALPGLVAGAIQPNLLSNALRALPDGVVLVSGSAGKSSTTHTLVELLQAHGKRVFTNPSTANIKQGLVSAVLKEGDLLGRLNYDIAVLEVDEGHGSALVGELKPRLVVLTNVLSDQLDRFIDPDIVIEKLKTMAGSAKQVVLNAHDPNLRSMALNNVVGAVDLSTELKGTSEAPRYALRFDSPPANEKPWLVEGTKQLSLATDLGPLALKDQNIPHALNTALAVTAAAKLIDLDINKTQVTIDSLPGVFARNELTSLDGIEVNLRLVQNPTSFQLNVDELDASNSPLMFMAGSDIHDPSWLWTVDFSSVGKVDIVSGFNAYDLALRLSYAGVEVGKVIPDVAEAKTEFMSLRGELPTILFSADSMRRFRRQAGLAK